MREEANRLLNLAHEVGPVRLVAPHGVHHAVEPYHAAARVHGRLERSANGSRDGTPTNDAGWVFHRRLWLWL